MNEPPDEPTGLSLRKNGPAILSKSYPPASFCTTGNVLESGGGEKGEGSGGVISVNERE